MLSSRLKLITSIGCSLSLIGNGVSHNDSKPWDSNWDKRDVSDDQERNKSSKVIHRIVMVRHGQYISSDNDKDRILTKKGREQAVLCGKRLQELVDTGFLFPIKYVYFSTMARASETHNLIMDNLSISPVINQPCSMIREGAVCRPNPPSTTWTPSDEDFFKDNLRVEAGFMNHVHRASKNDTSNFTTLLVCHGNVIRYFVCRALQIQPDHWLRMAVFNASITILDIHANGKVSLITLGDVGYMKPSMISYE